METQNPVIEIKNLSRRYGKLEAVNGLSLTVQPGRCSLAEKKGQG